MAFLVEWLLDSNDSITGRTFRKYLRESGVRWFFGTAGFYKDMCRLEDAGVVVGSYELDAVDDEFVRVRCYRLK